MKILVIFVYMSGKSLQKYSPFLIPLQMDFFSLKKSGFLLYFQHRS
jgi:hypothetical protein